MRDYQTQSLWRMRLGSALRTALACTIVDCTVLYGPPQLKKYITYPSFSYMTTILITPDATLGGVMRSCWHVIFATAQVLVSSMLTLWLVEPKNFTVEVKVVAVALSAFVVALPESTHLMSKRIAFGQFVNVYVGTVIHGAQTGVVMHPLGVASSTVLGALASVVVMLFPYPRLSYYEKLQKTYGVWTLPNISHDSPSSSLWLPKLSGEGATNMVSMNLFVALLCACTLLGHLREEEGDKKKIYLHLLRLQRTLEATARKKESRARYLVSKSWRMYAGNASQRLARFVEAISSRDKSGALELFSRGQSLSKEAAKLLQSISNNLETMVWERPYIKFLKLNYMDSGERLQEIEVPLRGMEIALSSCSSHPVNLIDEELRRNLQSSEVQVSLRLLQAKYSLPSDATLAPESHREIFDKPLWAGKPTTNNRENLPAFFFLYCMELLLENQPIARNPGNTRKPNQEPSDSQNQQRWNFKSVWRNIIPSTRSIIFALKCSLALGLAVLFGLLYNKENGQWSGLTIAINFVTGRQATFTVTNARVQGTTLGSIYGIIWLFIFQRLEKFKLLPLIPWIFFCHFLRHSKMYGQAGGISAAIGALLILGRENYGPPSEFAFARMTEASIGLLCFLLVEIVFYPMRVATLAKNKLSQSMEALRDCIEGVNLCVPASTGLREKQIKLKSHVKELETFIQEAETEPNCWFLPFQGAGYNRVLESLSKIADLFLFVAYKTEVIAQVEQNFGGVWAELRQQMNADLELLKGCLEEASLIKSMSAPKTMSESDYHDSELGKPPRGFATLGCTDDKEVETIVSSFLQHLQEVADKVQTSDSEEKHKSQMVLCLTSLGFCIPSVMRETMEMKKEVRKLVKLNAPT